jgi:hypothetical protein
MLMMIVIFVVLFFYVFNCMCSLINVFSFFIAFFSLEIAGIYSNKDIIQKSKIMKIVLKSTRV